MRLLHFLPFCILPLTTLAAKKSKGDRFEEFHSRSLSSSPLKLDDSLYDQLTATPRNYSALVLLTALEARYGCQMCREVQPEWELLAKSWVKGDKSGASRVLYGTLDFADGKGTFQKVRHRLCYISSKRSRILRHGLQLMLQSAPNLLLFPPTVGPNSKPDGQPARFDFSKGYAIYHSHISA